MKTRHLLFTLLLFTFLPLPLHAKTKKLPPKKGWILLWEDEFEGTEIDNSKWTIEDAALKKNKEKQYYAPDEVYLEDGILTLRSQEREMGKRKYTSGLVRTKGKFEQIYGRYEVRAKLPSTKGIWPAHWLMNTTGSWPPEIDIMEIKGSKPEIVHMTNHFGKWPKNRLEGCKFQGPDFSKDFHTFAVEWEPDEIRWYIDGVIRFKTNKNIPDVSFYLILNTAVGGTYDGDPDETTVFPQHHEIDYVRVYKRDEENTRKIHTLAENGRVVRHPDEPRYEIGSTVKFLGVPDIGYKFESFNDKVKKNPAKIKVTKDMRIKATFIEDPDPPQMISKGKKMFASSIQTERFPEKFANDGKMNTRWSSMFCDPQWLAVDLGKSCKVEAIRLRWHDSYARAYSIQISKDGIKWKTIKKVSKYKPGDGSLWFRNLSTRYIRVHGTVRSGFFGYSLNEFEVYGKE